jgi:hypothetical protein
VNPTTDVLYAQADVSHTYSGGSSWVASLSGCCRLGTSNGHVNNPDGSFRVETLVTTQAASSGSSSSPPIVDCPIDGVCSFTVPFAPPGGATVSYRLAGGSESGGLTQPGAPQATHEASISTGGHYTWDTHGASSFGDPTFYSTQVIVESRIGNTVVSRSAIDFFLRLTDEVIERQPECEDPDGGGVDDDDDGLCDNWEASGIDVDGDEVVDYYIAGADPNRKDIYVELDHMEGRGPRQESIDDVVAAFRRRGISLHVVIDEEIGSVTTLNFGNAEDHCEPSCPDDSIGFDDVKEDHFGTPAERGAANSEIILAAKRYVYHYNVWADHLNHPNNGGSGRGELPGNDFVVSLGEWRTGFFGGSPPSRRVESGTFMHELGHNLGLGHGGGDHVNCKPNYLSVMSYARQVPGLLPNPPLDYSDRDLATLNENDLDERVGIGGPPGLVTVHGVGRQTSRSASPINWDNHIDANGNHIVANINRIDGSGCTGTGSALLTGHDDWANLDLDFKTQQDFADGVHSTVPFQSVELTHAEAVEASADADDDGVPDIDDNCPLGANADQADPDGDGAGAPALTDVPRWVSTAVAWTTCRGFIEGFRDRTFRPDAPITRAQVARIIYRMAGSPAVDQLPPHDLVDVPSWVEPAVRALVAAGHLTGYPDQTFRPNRPMTRAEVARLLFRVRHQPSGSPPNRFSDVPRWADPAVSWLVDPDNQPPFATGYADGRFRPNQAITRAQFTRMIFRIVQRGDL